MDSRTTPVVGQRSVLGLRSLRVFPLCLLLIPFSFASALAAVGMETQPTTRERALAGEMIVRFDPDVSRPAQARILGEQGWRLVDRLGVDRALLVEVRTGPVAEAIERARREPLVRYAEVNHLYETMAIPDDERFPEQWALHNLGAQDHEVADADIDAPAAWDFVRESATPIAVIDTGVAIDHPELASNLWRNPAESSGTPGIDDDNNGFIDDVFGWDFVDDEPDVMDERGHGTLVAGIIAASGDNGTGIAGLQWAGKLMVLRAAGADGDASTADISSAISYAASQGARVINVSLGAKSHSQTLADTIASVPDVLVVASAGNKGSDNDVAPVYPCNLELDNVICVAATDARDELWERSNYGASSVDLAAPGVGIVSTIPPLADLFEDEFDAGLAAWETGGTVSSWGIESEGTDSYLSDSPGGPYSANSDSWIAPYETFDLRTYPRCHLNHEFRHALADDAVVHLELQEGSNPEWRTVATWTGSSEGWGSESHPLPAVDAMRFRFRLISGASQMADGVHVDEVELSCAETAYDGDEYGYQSGTSAAAPHVSGAAALLWGASPTASLADVRNALIQGGDQVSSLTGKTASGRRLNLYGALVHLRGEPVRRVVSLRLRDHLVATGRVHLLDVGAGSCARYVPLELRRNGHVLASDRSDAVGRYAMRVPDRNGRFRVHVVPVDAGSDLCARAWSVSRWHRHR